MKVAPASLRGLHPLLYEAHRRNIASSLIVGGFGLVRRKWSDFNIRIL
jgi:hypothetical protein